MALLSCLTGSYPPEHNANQLSSELPEDSREASIQSSIRRAVEDQIEVGIDILVDGQVRDDIIALFLPKLRGCVLQGANYLVTGPIRPSDKPITLGDFMFARSLAVDKRFKGHVTGPISLARAVTLATDKYENTHDPNLILDLAHAVAQDARHLVETGAEIVQIDEPALAHGVDIDLAQRAIRVIVDEARMNSAWLHACGDIRSIFDRLIQTFPVQAVNIEGAWLDYPELAHVDRTYLKEWGKKICYGCVRVDQPDIERPSILQRILGRAVDRFGMENIQAVTPNCGLRITSYAVAKKKMRVMVEAAKSAE